MTPPREATDNPFAGLPAQEADDLAWQMLNDVLRKCPGRPSLPHEREEYGEVRWLTAAGEQKYEQERLRIAALWADAGFDPLELPEPAVLV